MFGCDAHILARANVRAAIIDYNMRELVEVIGNQTAMIAANCSCPKFDVYVAELRALAEERAELSLWFFGRLAPALWGK